MQWILCSFLVCCRFNSGCCGVQCILAVGKCCKLDRLIIFSEILTMCEGLDVARLLGEPV